MSIEPTLESLVEQAREGNEAALEAVVRGIQNQVYNLALRMLSHPTDAEDATQEILIRVITHLSQYRGESAFTTWVYRVATNHLLTTRKRRAELSALNTEALFAHLDDSQLSTLTAQPDAVDQALLEQEVRLRCTLGMLLCLDREHRLAYILGEGFGVSSVQGAYIIGISEAAFRKRVSRARLRLQAFMEPKCGMIVAGKKCGCLRHLDSHTPTEKLRLANLLKTNPLGLTALRPDPGLVTRMQELAQLQRVAAVFKTQPLFAAPDRFVLAIKRLLASGKYEVFDF